MPLHYPRGNYWVEILNTQLGQTRKNEYPQVVIRFKPYTMENLSVPPNDPARWPALIIQAQERTCFLVIVPGSIEYVQKKMEAMGWVLESWEDLNNNPFAGMKVYMTCAHGSFESKEREEWDIPLGAFQAKPLSEDGISALDAEFGDHLPKAQPAAQDTQAAAQQAEKTLSEPPFQAPAQTPPQEQTADDLPFY